ncbi:MAG: LON peptidase substrate-binding domain-containing protein [Pelagibacteraceae bacterium]
MNSFFPETIPVFPLSGVIYFPKTNLPLNIFEQRYLDLVNDCLKKDKLMGMVQSKKNKNGVYNIGCLGKISDFKKDENGRIFINLTGLTRFEIVEEVINKKLYKEFIVKYEKFKKDIADNTTNQNESLILSEKIKEFFKKKSLLLNWKEFEKLEYTQQINTLSMIAPISNEEKQKLLETIVVEDRIKTFTEIIEFYSHSFNDDVDITVQ